MKKILLLITMLFPCISFYAQDNGRILKIIYDGCGYTSSVTEYKNGNRIFSLDFEESVYVDGFNVKQGSAQDIYNEMKLFSDFIEKHGNTNGYIENVGKYELMIVKAGKGAVGITSIMFLVVSNGDKSRRCDFQCIKKGKKVFEKYCKKNKIQLE